LNSIIPDNYIRQFIENALHEDIGDGDHTSLACIPPDTLGTARLLIKESGVLAGTDVARRVFSFVDENIRFNLKLNDGIEIGPGDVAFTVEGRVQSLLKSERLVLNIMQRMSGIASTTRQYVNQLKGLKTRILDTRKTTPGMRWLEKAAVLTGGGSNHRFGLHDMILIKDNHSDFSGGVDKAILRAHEYLMKTGKNLAIEVEARNLHEVRLIIKTGGVQRIMLDNFTTDDTVRAVDLIDGKMETESSGGITLDNIRQYALCGVDYVSVGALTHQIRSLDMSLKAILE